MKSLLFWTALGLTLGMAGGAWADTGDIRMSTTTSTDNSGLLRAILPAFEKKYGIRVQVIPNAATMTMKNRMKNMTFFSTATSSTSPNQEIPLE